MNKWGERHDYRGYGGCDCHCYIKVVGNAVLCTEADDNTGTSVTNFVEILMQEVCQKYGIPMENLVWIEHYEASPESFSHKDDTFDLVTFNITDHPSPWGRVTGKRFVNPKWKQADREWVEKTFGV